MTDLEMGQMLTESYLDALEEYGDDFKALMGAEAIKIFENIDLPRERS